MEDDLSTQDTNGAQHIRVTATHRAGTLVRVVAQLPDCAWMGGAVLGTREFVTKKLEPVLRYGGPTLSAFNAWVIAKGLETLSLRVRQQSANALEVAQ